MYVQFEEEPGRRGAKLADRRIAANDLLNGPGTETRPRRKRRDTVLLSENTREGATP